MPHSFSINIAAASTDFDGDWVCVHEILVEAESDLSARLAQLHHCDLDAIDSYVATLHEITNTLGTAWCFDASKVLRGLEDRIRGRSLQFTVAVHREILETAENGLVTVSTARKFVEQAHLSASST